MNLKEKMNALGKKKQLINGVVVVLGLIALWVVFSMISETPKPQKKAEKVELTGIIGNEFTEKNTESALTTQQDEISLLKEELSSTHKALIDMKDNQERLMDDLKASMMNQNGIMQRVDSLEEKPAMLDKDMPHELGGAAFQPYPPANGQDLSNVGTLVRISFRHNKEIEKNNDTFVPPGTFASAIVLLGADADASVNGQGQQSPMAFKLLDNGKIPGGGHSKLKNCVVLAGAYGDISSERVIVRLTHITCKSGPNKTIDTKIDGWASYNGKVNIKGIPLMRDDKILAWAGLSGMMSGFANAMQYSNTTQSVSALGSTSTVNTDDVAAYGMYGGASTAMNNLSNYYIKRADQYHPVIQVGAGNKVSLLFESGFFIVPHKEDAPIQPTASKNHVPIPPQLLRQMQQNNNSFGQTVGVEK